MNIIQNQIFSRNLSNSATKADLKNATAVDTSKFTKKAKICNCLKEIKWYIKNGAVKKDACNGNIKNIQDKLPYITNLTIITTLNAKINEVKNEIPSITNLATITVLNNKISKVKNKIPNIINLATTPAFTAVGSKIPYVNNLVKKTDYNIKNI